MEAYTLDRTISPLYALSRLRSMREAQGAGFEPPGAPAEIPGATNPLSAWVELTPRQSGSFASYFSKFFMGSAVASLPLTRLWTTLACSILTANPAPTKTDRDFNYELGFQAWSTVDQMLRRPTANVRSDVLVANGEVVHEFHLAVAGDRNPANMYYLIMSIPETRTTHVTAVEKIAEDSYALHAFSSDFNIEDFAPYASHMTRAQLLDFVDKVLAPFVTGSVITSRLTHRMITRTGFRDLRVDDPAGTITDVQVFLLSAHAIDVPEGTLTEPIPASAMGIAAPIRSTALISPAPGSALRLIAEDGISVIDYRVKSGDAGNALAVDSQGLLTLPPPPAESSLTYTAIDDTLTFTDRSGTQTTIVGEIGSQDRFILSIDTAPGVLGVNGITSTVSSAPLGAGLSTDSGRIGLDVCAPIEVTPAGVFASIVSEDVGNSITADASGLAYFRESVKQLRRDSAQSVTLRDEQGVDSTLSSMFTLAGTTTSVTSLALQGGQLVMESGGEIATPANVFDPAVQAPLEMAGEQDIGVAVASPIAKTADGLFMNPVSGDAGNDVSAGSDGGAYFAETVTGMSLDGEDLTYVHEKGTDTIPLPLGRGEYVSGEYAAPWIRMGLRTSGPVELDISSLIPAPGADTPLVAPDLRVEPSSDPGNALVKTSTGRLDLQIVSSDPGNSIVSTGAGAYLNTYIKTLSWDSAAGELVLNAEHGAVHRVAISELSPHVTGGNLTSDGTIALDLSDGTVLSGDVSFLQEPLPVSAPFVNIDGTISMQVSRDPGNVISQPPGIGVFLSGDADNRLAVGSDGLPFLNERLAQLIENNVSDFTYVDEAGNSTRTIIPVSVRLYEVLLAASGGSFIFRRSDGHTSVATRASLVRLDQVNAPLSGRGSAADPLRLQISPTPGNVLRVSGDGILTLPVSVTDKLSISNGIVSAPGPVITSLAHVGGDIVYTDEDGGQFSVPISVLDPSIVDIARSGGVLQFASHNGLAFEIDVSNAIRVFTLLPMVGDGISSSLDTSIPRGSDGGATMTELVIRTPPIGPRNSILKPDPVVNVLQVVEPALNFDGATFSMPRADITSTPPYVHSVVTDTWKRYHLHPYGWRGAMTLDFSEATEQSAAFDGPGVITVTGTQWVGHTVYIEIRRSAEFVLAGTSLGVWHNNCKITAMGSTVYITPFYRRVDDFNSFDMGKSSMAAHIDYKMKYRYPSSFSEKGRPYIDSDFLMNEVYPQRTGWAGTINSNYLIDDNYFQKEYVLYDGTNRIDFADNIVSTMVFLVRTSGLVGVLMSFSSKCGFGGYLKIAQSIDVPGTIALFYNNTEIGTVRNNTGQVWSFGFRFYPRHFILNVRDSDGYREQMYPVALSRFDAVTCGGEGNGNSIRIYRVIKYKYAVPSTYIPIMLDTLRSSNNPFSAPARPFIDLPIYIPDVLYGDAWTFTEWPYMGEVGEGSAATSLPVTMTVTQPGLIASYGSFTLGWSQSDGLDVRSGALSLGGGDHHPYPATGFLAIAGEPVHARYAFDTSIVAKLFSKINHPVTVEAELPQNLDSTPITVTTSSGDSLSINGSSVSFFAPFNSIRYPRITQSESGPLLQLTLNQPVALSALNVSFATAYHSHPDFYAGFLKLQTYAEDRQGRIWYADQWSTTPRRLSRPTTGRMLWSGITINYSETRVNAIGSSFETDPVAAQRSYRMQAGLMPDAAIQQTMAFSSQSPRTTTLASLAVDFTMDFSADLVLDASDTVITTSPATANGVPVSETASFTIASAHPGPDDAVLVIHALAGPSVLVPATDGVPGPSISMDGSPVTFIASGTQYTLIVDGEILIEDALLPDVAFGPGNLELAVSGNAGNPLQYIATTRSATPPSTPLVVAHHAYLRVKFNMPAAGPRVIASWLGEDGLAVTPPEPAGLSYERRDAADGRGAVLLRGGAVISAASPSTGDGLLAVSFRRVLDTSGSIAQMPFSMPELDAALSPSDRAWRTVVVYSMNNYVTLVVDGVVVVQNVEATGPLDFSQIEFTESCAVRMVGALSGRCPHCAADTFMAGY